MKITKPISVFVLLAAGAMPGIAGEAFRTDINPALQYYQAFAVDPNLEPADNSYLLNTDWRGQKLPERFGKLVARYDAQFGLVRRAAHAAVPCDWGIDMSAGPATLLPYLARAKTISQTARLRAMWACQQGRPADAWEDLLAAFALGRNLSRDGTVISVLVQTAIESIVYATVAENFGRFSPETLKRLLDGFDAAPARGTVAACIPTEKASFHDWTLRKILELQKQHPGNDAEVMAGMRQLFLGLDGPEPGEEYWERLTRAAGGTSDGVIKLLQGREQMYERLAVLLTLPYREYESRMKDFSAEIEKSLNPFVSETFPGFARAQSREFRILAELAMVRAAVEYKLHGEEGFKHVADPCGKGPFAFERFVFEGVDRGFELKSQFDADEYPQVLIFIEKEGPSFYVNGKNAGQPLPGASTETDAFRRRYGIAPGK